MTTYSPALSATTETHGLDRLLVRVGTTLADLGRRRAVVRSARAAHEAHEAPVAEPGERVRVREIEVYRADLDERRRDNAAATHPLLLR